MNDPIRNTTRWPPTAEDCEHEPGDPHGQRVEVRPKEAPRSHRFGRGRDGYVRDYKYRGTINYETPLQRHFT